MRSSTRSSMLAAATLAMLAVGDAMPPPRKGSARAYKPTPAKRDTAQAREIAEHNAEVDRRKAEKKAAKLARRVA